MVKDSGTTVRADRLRPLNTPRPLRVETDERGRPTAVGLASRALTPIEEVLDRWRIDDEWWRKEVSRSYFHVALEGGQLLTLFQDLTTGRWFGQTSATPLPGESAEPLLVSRFGASTPSAAIAPDAGKLPTTPTPIRRAG